MSRRGGWVRVYRALLRLLPRRMRDRSAGELDEVFERVVEDARLTRGRLAGHLRAARECGDVTGLALRAAAGRARRVAPDLRGGVDDLRVAVRSLLRRPGFALAAAGTLAVGIGATTAIFAVADTLLLRPLPYPAGDRLVMLWRVVERYDMRRAPVSLPDFADWRERAVFFDGMAAWVGSAATLQGEGGPVRLQGYRVAGDLFGTLQVPVALGRPLIASDAGPDAEPVVVISDALWRGRFGGDPSVVGRRLELGGASVRVVGVAPAGFTFPAPGAQFWSPVREDPSSAERDLNFLTPVARLAEGVDRTAAEERLGVVVRAVQDAHPGENEVDGVWLEPRRTYEAGDARGMVLLLGGAVGVLLLLACANLTGLLLVRASARRGELAVRSALGAGSAGIARTLAAEGLALALVGAAAGAALAALLLEGLTAVGPDALLARGLPSVDGRVLAFCVAAAAACALACAAVPARAAVRAGPARALRGAGGTRAPRTGRLHDGLVVTQVGLATLLLVAAGLLLASLDRLLSEPMGFDVERVLAAPVALPEGRYPDPAAAAAFYDELFVRLAARPESEAVGGSWAPPLMGMYAGTAYRAADAPPDAAPVRMSLVPVRGDYLRALGVPVLEGRGFEPADGAEGAPVALVSRSLARTLWPDGSAVGRRLVKEDGGGGLTVVGVVGDVRRAGPGRDPDLEVYLPHDQATWARDLVVVVRARDDPAPLAEALRDVVRELDPRLPLAGVTTLRREVSAAAAEPRSRALLLGGFAVAAALLAAIGVYGVLAYRVAQRRAEVALRVALGAPQAAVRRGVLARAAALGAAGLALGLGAASLAAPALRAFLFGVSPLEPFVYAGVAALVAAAVAAAGWLPARRAARVDPMATLRSE